jgi:endonuclease YncB( thermonuclease family)
MYRKYPFQDRKPPRFFDRPKKRLPPSAQTIRLGLLLGMAAALFGGAALQNVIETSSPSGSEFAHCSRWNRENCVIDGDTIRYRGIKIRLADIDAPETYEFKCAAELALGRRATARLLELINAGPFDIVRSGGRDADAHGRKLRLIERNGRSLGGVLVAEGLARRWDGARHSWCG